MRLPAARGRAGLRLAVLALAAFGGMTAAGAIAVPAASAHAVLVSSIPVDGSRVNTAPAQVRLTFDEPVGLIAADEQVISATGARADTGQVRLAEGGTTIVLPPRPHLPRGTYSATWWVVSADTHVVSGSITFGLGVQPGAGVVARPDHTGQLDVTADIAEGLIYAGLVLLAGITTAARLLWPWTLPSRRVRGLTWAGWAALAAGTAAEFALQGPGPSTLAGRPCSGCGMRAARWPHRSARNWRPAWRCCCSSCRCCPGAGRAASVRAASGRAASGRTVGPTGPQTSCAPPPGSRSWSRSRSPDTRRRDRTWRWRCPPRSCTWRRWRCGSAAWWCSGSRCSPCCAAARSPTRACGDGR